MPVRALRRDGSAPAGGIDISFNAISYGDVQGTPLADFERPVMTATRTMFLTTRAAARHMIRQRSGAPRRSTTAATPTR